MWGNISVIPIVRRLKQENFMFEASLGYIRRACFQNKQANKKRHLCLVIVLSVKYMPSNLNHIPGTTCGGFHEKSLA